ncbi:hypothetical protein IP69_17285 [Bosea sp. AAP35]|uniref:Crp/Fnr family transcriptional regulator n=1 Tax=Bosea sp. AAP35 TaxID=1523417 RepID=UPI0006B9C258|nr:Crp/Fnr family transcriptional regulator [Bosea sp. AAP35]KPF65695.1 hypothetical protein IP69_17285 [Bosea sp. AAP35]MCC5611809.1 Crp/Fnr family transcriptional regulator [Nostoc sp. CHAB 5834]
MKAASSHLAKKLAAFMPLSERESACLNDLLAAPFAVERGVELVRQGDERHFGYVLHSGWGCSFKVLHDGARQIITFPLPGDCIGMRSVLLRTSDHAFSSLTDAVVSRIESSRIMQMFNEFPRLGAAILWSVSRDEAITVDHLASIGRRTALERTAHFFIELGERLRLVGLASGNTFECPLTQNDLADALGLSAIHINRVLRQLRELDLMTFHDHSVVLLDQRKMRVLAGYDEIA